MSNFKLATYASGVGGLADITTLLTETTAPPNPAPFHDAVITGVSLNNAPQENGYPSCEWNWAWLTATDLAVLGTYCPNASALVYITTEKNDGTTANYLATMWRPTSDPMGSLRGNVVVKFTKLEVQV